MLRASVIALLSCFAWCWSSGALAQQGTAALVGTVTDVSTGKPVADTVVTVTSPSLQGEELTVTDATGTYRIPGLPPGIYVLRLEGTAYKPYSRDTIELRADTTIRVNAALLPEALQAEVVEVVARAPTVDVGSSATGLNISSEFTQRVPVSMPGSKGSAVRSFESVADIVPQAAPDLYGVSVNGSSSPENAYLIDGLSVNNSAFGVIGTPLSIEFVKEVSVISGGYMPEYGRTMGGVINAITKTGSNEFHSSVFSNIAPGALEGNRHRVRRQGQTIGTDPSLSSIGDLGGDVSGPIIKDKLWFYAGFDWSRTSYDLKRSLYQTQFDDMGEPILDGNGDPVRNYIPGSSRTYNARQDAIQGIGKLTWAASRKDRLSLSLNGNWLVPGQGNRFGIDPFTGLPSIGGNSTASANINGTRGALATRQPGSSTNVLLNWQREIDGKRTVVDTTVGFQHLSGGRMPSDGSGFNRRGLAGISNVTWSRIDPPHSITEFESVPAGACQAPDGNPDAVSCPVSDYHTGGPDFMSEQKLNRYMARSVLSHLFTGLGHHVAKLGVDTELFTYDNKKSYAGGRSLLEAADGSFFYDGRQLGFLAGPDQPVLLDNLHNKTKSVTLGTFLQDSWNIMDMVTVNLGLRYDAQLLYAADGNLAMALAKQWSPRAGIIYDFTRDGRSKIFANYARYYQSVPLDVIDRAASGESYILSARDPAACDPRTAAGQQGACEDDANRIPIFGGPNYNYGVLGSGRAPVDPKIKAPSTDEFVAGGEYEIFRDGRVGLSYTKRWLNHTIEDMSRDEAQSYFIGNPGYGVAKDFPKAERRYDAITLYFQKSFSAGWLAQASYTASWLRGNYAGLFRNEDGQLDPFMNSDFDIKSLTINRKGYLPGDRRHAIKLFGAKDFEIHKMGHLTPGMSFRAFSGAPTSYLGGHPYGADLVYVLDRGEGERLPWSYSADVRLAYGLVFDKSRTLTFTVDVFNLFNFQSAIQRDERYTAATVAPVQSGGVDNLTNADGTPFDSANVNPNFGRATGYQAPRIFRFGLRATF